MRRILPLLVPILLFFPAAAIAEGIPIRNGEWKFTTRTVVSVTPQPREVETVGCIAQETVGADELTGESGFCENQEVRVSGNVMTWKVVCRGRMAGNTGEGRLEMNDATFEGEMKLRGAPRPDGEPIVVTTTWQGERSGECRPPPSDPTDATP